MIRLPTLFKPKGTAACCGKQVFQAIFAWQSFRGFIGEVTFRLKMTGVSGSTA